MASRRILKKSINNLTMELVSECLTYRYFHTDKPQEKTEKTMENLVMKRNELISRVNNPLHKEDYKKNRDFYRTIVKDLNLMVSVMDELA